MSMKVTDDLFFMSKIVTTFKVIWSELVCSVRAGAFLLENVAYSKTCIR